VRCLFWHVAQSNHPAQFHDWDSKRTLLDRHLYVFASCYLHLVTRCRHCLTHLALLRFQTHPTDFDLHNYHGCHFDGHAELCAQPVTGQVRSQHQVCPYLMGLVAILQVQSTESESTTRCIALPCGSPESPGIPEDSDLTICSFLWSCCESPEIAAGSGLAICCTFL